MFVAGSSRLRVGRAALDLGLFLLLPERLSRFWAPTFVSHRAACHGATALACAAWQPPTLPQRGSEPYLEKRQLRDRSKESMLATPPRAR
jgi:hypothetical protein